MGEVTGSLIEDLAMQFENQENCDVVFEVDGNTIGVHKFMLQARNRVLHNMALSRISGEEPITIDNIDFDSLKTLIRYIYTDKISLTNENVFIFLHAATHFKMPRLDKLCADHINNTMNTENVCVFMEEAVNFKSTALKDRCQEVFSKQTYAVLKEKSFLQTSQPALSVFLDSENTNTLEIKLFAQCKIWMTQKFRQLKLPVNGTNMRHVIGDALYKIRFPTMSVQDFANSVSTISGLLTDTEMAEVFQMITVFNSKNIQCLFPTKFRCQSHNYSTPYKEMAQLITSQVLYNHANNQYNDLMSIINHLTNTSDGEAMRVTSLRLVFQCCADLANSSMRYRYPDSKNQNIRDELLDDFGTWQDLVNTKNIHDIMTKFKEIREKLDKICAWG